MYKMQTKVAFSGRAASALLSLFARSFPPPRAATLLPPAPSPPASESPSSDLCPPQEGGRSLVLEEQPGSRRSRVFPVAGLPDALPQLSDLGGPLNEVVMARLSFATAAPPTCARADRMGSLGWVGADRRVAGEELKVAVSHHLPLPLQTRVDGAVSGRRYRRLPLTWPGI